MKLVCPSCGITASAELWAEDAATRDFIGLVIRAPKAVQDELLRYLGLFRPEKRALSMARAKSLTEELLEHVRTGTISWDGKPPRPCPPEIWAEAMREMTSKKGGQKVHFTNHNYLRAIAYQLADKADAVNERKREERLRERTTREPDEEDGGGVPDEAKALIDKIFRRRG